VETQVSESERPPDYVVHHFTEHRHKFSAIHYIRLYKSHFSKFAQLHLIIPFSPPQITQPPHNKPPHSPHPIISSSDVPLHQHRTQCRSGHFNNSCSRKSQIQKSRSSSYHTRFFHSTSITASTAILSTTIQIRRPIH
jgi:hypothetical protein